MTCHCCGSYDSTYVSKVVHQQLIRPLLDNSFVLDADEQAPQHDVVRQHVVQRTIGINPVNQTDANHLHSSLVLVPPALQILNNPANIWQLLLKVSCVALLHLRKNRVMN